jgi:hypothetical protein
MKNKHCEWCDHEYAPNVSYQKYCSSECREDATREKIRAKYVLARLKKRATKVRLCTSCRSPLSIYNDEPICNHCSVDPKEVMKAIKEIKDLMNGKP